MSPRRRSSASPGLSSVVTVASITPAERMRLVIARVSTPAMATTPRSTSHSGRALSV
jgi:hypothetical protein